MEDNDTTPVPFSLIADVESCACTYDTIENLLILLDDELWRETRCIKPDEPGTAMAFLNRFSVIQALLITILVRVADNQKELNRAVEQLYECHRTKAN